MFPWEGQGEIEIWYPNDTNRYFDIEADVEIIQNGETVDGATVQARLAPHPFRLSHDVH